MSTKDHEQVSIYPFSEKQRDALMSQAGECAFNWTTKDGWAVGVIHAYTWHKGSVWLTCGGHRHRVSAIRRDPRCSVIVSGISAPGGPSGAITIKGRAVIHEDEATKSWFYPALARRPAARDLDAMTPAEEEQAKAFEKRLDSPLRVVIEIVPEKWITFDGEKMGKDTRGELTEEERGPLLEADSVRMPAEIQRRGLN